MRRLAAIGAVAAIVLAGTAFGARSSETRYRYLPFLSNGVAPKQLPRYEPAPIEFTISGDLRVLSGGIPPTLIELVLRTDRNGSLDVTGLPACGRRRLQSFDTAAVETACRDAIVGIGAGEAIIAYPETSPMPAKSDLLVVNGGIRGRLTTFFIRGMLSPPVREVVVGTVKIERIDEGRYGLRARVKVPPIAEGYGHIATFALRLKRRFGFEDEKRSAFSARCADGKFVNEATVTFRDGQALTEKLLRTCSSRLR